MDELFSKSETNGGDPLVSEMAALCRCSGKSFLELAIPGFYEVGGGYDTWKGRA